MLCKYDNFGNIVGFDFNENEIKIFEKDEKSISIIADMTKSIINTQQVEITKRCEFNARACEANARACEANAARFGFQPLITQN